MVASLQEGYGEIGAGVKRLMYVVWCVCVWGGKCALLLLLACARIFKEH